MFGISEPGLIVSGSSIQASNVLRFERRRAGRQRLPRHQMRQVRARRRRAPQCRESCGN